MENGARFLKKKTIVITRCAADFGIHWKFVITNYYQRNLASDSLFRNNRASEMFFFLNFDLDLDCQGNLSHELDQRTKCDNFGENFMKIG